MAVPLIDGGNIDPGEVSGGGSGGIGGAIGGAFEPPASISEFTTEEGGLLAEAFGEHLVGGQLVVHKYLPGPPPSSTFVVALGAGEWDAPVTVWYAGEPQSASPDGSTPGYHFHPGTISTGVSDPIQGVDSFLPSGLAYSGTAYLAVKLPEILAVEDRPDKLRGRFRCKKVADYDLNGVQTGFSYSANPARVAADRIRRQYELRYFNDLPKALDKFRRRIHWPRWIEFRDYCDFGLLWETGEVFSGGLTEFRAVLRFECHIAFTAEAELADVLDQICATAAAFWQDDGEQIIFLTPAEQQPVHHFHTGYLDINEKYVRGNIKEGTFSISPRDIRERPNFFIAKFRDIHDEFLSEISVEVKRERLIEKAGKITSERRFPNMSPSQAMRLLERQARIEADNPFIVTLKGKGDSMHVLPGDWVTVSHPIPPWTHQKCLVLEARVDPGEKSPDEVEFSLLKVDFPLYSDSDHRPLQGAEAP